MTQLYRVAELTCDANREALGLGIATTSIDHNVNGKGTIHHKILESKRSVPYVDGDGLDITVACRVLVGRLEEPVRFGLAATLEIGAGVRADIHREVSERLRPRIQVESARG